MVDDTGWPSYELRPWCRTIRAGGQARKRERLQRGAGLARRSGASEARHVLLRGYTAGTVVRDVGSQNRGVARRWHELVAACLPRALAKHHLDPAQARFVAR